MSVSYAEGNQELLFDKLEMPWDMGHYVTHDDLSTTGEELRTCYYSLDWSQSKMHQKSYMLKMQNPNTKPSIT